MLKEADEYIGSADDDSPIMRVVPNEKVHSKPVFFLHFRNIQNNGVLCHALKNINTINLTKMFLHINFFRIEI